MSDPLLPQLFVALDIVVLERCGDGTYRSVAELPRWWGNLDSELHAAHGRFRPADELPFLRDFLAEPEQLWNDEPSGWFSSGVWLETLDDSMDCYLEASAVRRDGRDVLLIQRLDRAQAERFTVIQKGRENKLAYLRDVAQHERLAVELRGAKQAAEELTRAKSDFLARMSHELRTPMNGVMGMTRLLLESSPTSEQRGYLQAVHDSAQSLLDLVNDILDFSKAEAGKMELSSIAFSLHDVIGDTLKLLEATARQKGLALVWEIAAEVPDRLVGDPLRLRQVVFNLVGNAIKFTDAGRVMVEICREPRSQDAGNLRFAVCDTGVGVPAGKRETIFDAFAQADESDARRYQGTGLGLSIARQLVELMGGHIWLANSSERGSTFCFTTRFEVQRQSVDESASSQNSADSPKARLGRSLRILLAEDNEINRHVAIKMLERRGHSLLAVENGRQALVALEEERFDVVLMDCQMPVMDGLEAAAAVRRRERHTGRHVPIVALTAKASAEDRDCCLTAGMDAYVTKPLDADELNRLLQDLACANESPA